MPPRFKGGPRRGGAQNPPTPNRRATRPPSCSPAPPVTSLAHLAGAAGRRLRRGRRRQLREQLARGAGAAANGCRGARRCSSALDVATTRRWTRCSRAIASTRWCTSPRSRRWARSVRKPLEYYRNNLGGLVALAQAMQRHGCRRLVFSSQRHGVRPARAAADHRGRAAVRHQPLRPHQADGRGHAARPGALRRRRGAIALPALLQPGGRARERAASARTRGASRTT